MLPLDIADNEVSAIFDRWQMVDRATQRWVRVTGREISLGEHGWLDGPVGAPSGIGDDWMDRHARRLGAVTSRDSDLGLLPDMGMLAGPGFRPTELAPQVRQFYEHTGAWSLQLWSQWSRWAEPGGRLLNAVFARRLRQLALPLDPLDVAHGMTSEVVACITPEGDHLGTAWQRELRATGTTVFGGFYGVSRLPEERRRSVRVVFPLPNGSLMVFLRPEVVGDGRLRLLSTAGRFGSNGAYLVVVLDGGQAAVRRVPLHECFEVYVDDLGTLRCDHTLDFFSSRVLQLHYQLEGPTAR